MFNNFNVNMTYFYSLKEIFYCRRHFSLNIGRGKDWIKIRFNVSFFLVSTLSIPVLLCA